MRLATEALAAPKTSEKVEKQWHSLTERVARIGVALTFAGTLTFTADTRQVQAEDNFSPVAALLAELDQAELDEVDIQQDVTVPGDLPPAPVSSGVIPTATTQQEAIHVYLPLVEARTGPRVEQREVRSESELRNVLAEIEKVRIESPGLTTIFRIKVFPINDKPYTFSETLRVPEGTTLEGVWEEFDQDVKMLFTSIAPEEGQVPGPAIQLQRDAHIERFDFRLEDSTVSSFITQAGSTDPQEDRNTGSLIHTSIAIQSSSVVSGPVMDIRNLSRHTSSSVDVTGATGTVISAAQTEVLEVGASSFKSGIIEGETDRNLFVKSPSIMHTGIEGKPVAINITGLTQDGFAEVVATTGGNQLDPSSFVNLAGVQYRVPFGEVGGILVSAGSPVTLDSVFESQESPVRQLANAPELTIQDGGRFTWLYSQDLPLLSNLNSLTVTKNPNGGKAILTIKYYDNDKEAAVELARQLRAAYPELDVYTDPQVAAAQ